MKTLLTLIRLDLEGAPPGAPLAGFTLVAHPDQPRQGQLSLFGPASLSHDKLMATIARIASFVGEERIGAAGIVDGHLPERFHMEQFDPPPPPRVRRTARKARGLFTVRVIRPAIPLEVIAEERTDEWSRATKRKKSGDLDRDLLRLQLRTVQSLLPPPLKANGVPEQKPIEIRGSVRVASGPWRIEEKWWAEGSADRDYWDVELTTGGIYRIYRERESGSWFADGMYD